MTEAVSGMIDKSRSGIKGIQLQNEQDVVLRLLPTLNEGLAAKKIPDLRIGCYMILAIMASKGGLDDKLLTAMMEAVVQGWTFDTYTPALVCLAILAQQRGAKQMPKSFMKALLKVSDLPKILQTISKQHRIDKLANGLCLALIHRLGKNGDANVLSMIEQIISNELLTESQAVVAVKSCLLVAYKLDDIADPDGGARTRLAKSLTNLAEESAHVGTLVRRVMEDQSIDMDDLELRLQAVVRPKALPTPEDEDVAMEDNPVAASTTDSFGFLFAQLTAPTASEVSFLAHSRSPTYDDLCRVFQLTVGTAEHLKEFEQAPLLRRANAADEALYLSFFTRLWSGNSIVLARAAAIQIVTRRLEEQVGSPMDFQNLIPYTIVALNDPAVKVRRASSELLQAIHKLFAGKVDKKKGLKVWASDDFYGQGFHSKNLKSLSSDHAAHFVSDVLLPSLEECVLDRSYIISVLDKSLNSSKNSGGTPKKNDGGHISQALRSAILSFLSSHAINTPLLLVKLRLLKSLNLVRGVASTTRTKVLLPLLQQWADLSEAAADKLCVDEQISHSEFDSDIVNIVVPHDAAGLNFLQGLINGQVISGRPKLVAATFHWYEKMWPSLKGQHEIDSAELMMSIAHWSSGEPGPDADAQGQAMQLLRNVKLSSEALAKLLDDLPTAAKLADKAPATKRRRVSHGEVAKIPIQDAAVVTGAISKVTFVLQLIDGSEPQKHPELLKGLFNALAELQHFKAQVGSELGYLQGLVLSSLLSIMTAYKTDKSLKLDRNAVRADLLVDCVQKTHSPQVQNSALLLISSLSETAPELVLHSVMPIFTFMGSSVLRQNDEYSAHVIKQTIKEVIPPLIASLRKEKGNPVTGAAELLLSFVAAYEHVPAHRRKGLFASLVQTLGADDFLFALLAMLVDKYGATDDIKAFTTDLSGSFSVDCQLQSSTKYLDLVRDVLMPKPTVSNVLLSVSESSSKDSHQSAQALLELLPHLLSHKRLVMQTSRILERDDMDAARVREVYSVLLKDLLLLADTLKTDRSLHSACGDVLASLLGLLSTSEFVKSVESLLDGPNEDLRRKILKSLELRITQENQFNVAARQAMLSFLPQLTAIIRESDDILYKHTAVACVDKIAEKYGKMDLEAVAAAAETIAGDHCLGQSDARLRVMALLCLASLVEILREGIVSVLPVAIPKALEYVQDSIDKDDEALHNAGYAFVSSLLQHLPYMISAANISQLLVISNKSAEAAFDEESDESRISCMQMAAKQIDAKVMFTVLEKNWEEAMATGADALREFLAILSTAIDRHTKANVTKNSTTLSAIFLQAFDLQRMWQTLSLEEIGEDDLVDLEERINAVAIKMIYKFNDSTFRPIFARLIEWASTGLPKKDKLGKSLRLQSVYSFMTVFFESLKSIVTNYATYVLESIVDVLSNVDTKDENSKKLWSRALELLLQCFSHDQDDFWQSPAHFDAIAPILVAQMLNATSLPLVQYIIPTVVELAAAADSADHHKELNAAILKHMRSETAAVRLVAVKCEQALTDKLGEEWLSMLPEMLPFISELQEDDDEVVEKETHRWIVKIEGVLGESLDSMLQ